MIINILLVCHHIFLGAFLFSLKGRLQHSGKILDCKSWWQFESWSCQGLEKASQYFVGCYSGWASQDSFGWKINTFLVFHTGARLHFLSINWIRIKIFWSQNLDFMLENSNISRSFVFSAKIQIRDLASLNQYQILWTKMVLLTQCVFLSLIWNKRTLRHQNLMGIFGHQSLMGIFAK